ncbi:MAG: argininosuccinate synthase [Phycisphaerae bacterium]
MKRKAVLAFSGGLDTSFCAVWLAEQGYEVHTVTVQTDSATDELAAIERRARALGVADHRTIDARGELFNDYLRYLIFAGALRGDVYPLCVSAERVVQAKRCALHAVEIGATALAHGSTAAGNDQVRFDVAFRVFAPAVEIATPVRALGLTREQEVAYLAERGVEVPAKIATYSINRGLWGATIGGAETHAGEGALPEEAYVLTRSAGQWPTAAEDVRISFEAGVPVALDDERLDPVRLIDELTERAGRHGVGRGMHVGDTILGIKGRVAFEAPAATVLITAHRELEKLVLSRQQLLWKRTLGDLYASGLHEARFFDPLMRDLEAFLMSSQQRVHGQARVRLHAGRAEVLGATSPYSLLGCGARYGETAALWNGADAAAFSRLYGLQDELAAQVARQAEANHAAVD